MATNSQYWFTTLYHLQINSFNLEILDRITNAPCNLLQINYFINVSGLRKIMRSHVHNKGWSIFFSLILSLTTRECLLKEFLGLKNEAEKGFIPQIEN